MNWTAVLVAMLPEHLLLAGIVGLLLVPVLGLPRSLAPRLALVTVAAAALAAAWLGASGHVAAPFPGQYSVEPAMLAAKAIVLLLALPLVLLARDDFPRDERCYALLLSALYGIGLVMGADSFLTLFLGLELMSLPVYALVLLAFTRPDSAEAALKYLVLGGAASATFLMGASLLFGWSGSLGLSAFSRALASGETLAAAGVVLVVAAFFLKAAIVPFHTWAPDAYEAASVPVTAFMATLIKAGALFAIARLFDVAPVVRPLLDLVAVLPLVSMLWGNLAAMRQTSFRRLIAYSSIAHAGYLFFVFLGHGPGRYQAVVFYLLVYGLTTVLAFAVLPAGPDATRDRIDGLRGLFRRRPLAAIAMAASMLSLAGIPPLPGFVAKFLVFKNVLAAGHVGYAVAGLLASYVGLYFYLRVIQLAFMAPDEEGAAVVRGPAGTGETAVGVRAAIGAAVLCAVPTVLLIVAPGSVLAWLAH